MKKRFRLAVLLLSSLFLFSCLPAAVVVETEKAQARGLKVLKRPVIVTRTKVVRPKPLVILSRPVIPVRLQKKIRVYLKKGK